MSLFWSKEGHTSVQFKEYLSIKMAIWCFDLYFSKLNKHGYINIKSLAEQSWFIIKLSYKPSLMVTLCHKISVNIINYWYDSNIKTKYYKSIIWLNFC